MNEVEKHYSGQTGAGHSPSRAGQSGASGLADTIKSKAGDARETVEDAYGKASQWASGQYGSATRRVDGARRASSQGLDQTRRQVTEFVEENPVMVGVVGIAAGLLIGSLIPGTRRENTAFGRYADEVRDQGMRYARELAEQGKHFVEESLETATSGAPRPGNDPG